MAARLFLLDFGAWRAALDFCIDNRPFEAQSVRYHPTPKARKTMQHPMVKLARLTLLV
jgi:hypothetical protein